MTGIERLRELIKRNGPGGYIVVPAVYGSYQDGYVAGVRDICDKLSIIYDQIRSDLDHERDRWDSELCEAQMDKTRVMSVYLEMNKHVSGVEGAEDSPVARWARELRDALKSDTSDAAEQQNPSWHDPDGASDVTSEAAKVTRDHAEDVSMSAYDLLPADERDAIAWVREHGGLDEVKLAMKNLLFGLNETCVRLEIECSGSTPRDYQSVWREIRALKSRLKESVPRAAYERHLARRQRQIDESHAALRRRNARIAELKQQLSDLTNEVQNQCLAFGVDVSECDDASDMLHDMNEALSKRLMPEGMELDGNVLTSYSDGLPRCAGLMVMEATLVSPDCFCAWGSPRDGSET